MGLAEDNIGRFDVPRGSRAARAIPPITFGGLNGWAVTKNAPDEAIDFLQLVHHCRQSAQHGRRHGHDPGRHRCRRWRGQPARSRCRLEALADSHYHQNYLDQDLGPNLGRTVNDVSVDSGPGAITPEEAAQTLQDTADLESMN